MAQLPTRRSKNAPEFFKGQFFKVKRFIDQYNRLLLHHQVVTEVDKCSGILEYCSRPVQDYIQSSPHYITPDWKSLQEEILNAYEAEKMDNRVRMTDLFKFIQQISLTTITNLSQWKKYYREYQSNTGFLQRKGQLDDTAYHGYFWYGIPRHLQSVLDSKLLAKYPAFDTTEPWPVAAVNEVAEAHFKRNKFAERLLHLPALGLEEDYEPYEEEESEDSEYDSDSEYEERRRHKARMRKKNKKPSRAKQDFLPPTRILHEEPSRNIVPPPEEKGIEGLIKHLNTMSLEDPSYGTLYYQAVSRDRTGFAAQCITRKPIQSSANRNPREYSFQSRMNPPSYPRGILPRNPQVGMMQQPRCYGCGDPSHSMRDCPKLANLVLNKVITIDPHNFRYRFPDGKPIFRQTGESMVDAINRIHPQQDPGKVQFATIGSSVENFYAQVANRNHEYYEYSESEDEAYEESHWTWRDKRRKEYPSYAAYEAYDEEEEEIESQQRKHHASYVTYESGEEEEEPYQSYPAERGEEDRVIRQTRQTAMRDPVNRARLDGVYMPPRKTTRFADKPPISEPVPVKSLPPKKPFVQQEVRRIKENVPMPVLEQIPVEARKPRNKEALQDVAMKEPEPYPKKKVTLQDVSNRPKTEEEKNSEAQVDRTRSGPRHSELSHQVNTKAVVDHILDTQVSLPLRKILGASKELSSNLQEVIKYKSSSLKPAATGKPNVYNGSIQTEEHITAQDFPIQEMIGKPIPENRTLIQLTLFCGKHPISAVIDTGSQLNVANKAIVGSHICLPVDITKEIIMNDVNGNSGKLMGVINNVPLNCGSVRTEATEVYVGDNVPFDLLLGRPWQRGNLVTIDERVEGTYLVFKDKRSQEPRFEVFIQPNQMVQRTFKPIKQVQVYSATKNKELGLKTILADIKEELEDISTTEIEKETFKEAGISSDLKIDQEEEVEEPTSPAPKVEISTPQNMEPESLDGGEQSTRESEQEIHQKSGNWLTLPAKKRELEEFYPGKPPQLESANLKRLNDEEYDAGTTYQLSSPKSQDEEDLISKNISNHQDKEESNCSKNICQSKTDHCRKICPRTGRRCEESREDFEIKALTGEVDQVEEDQDDISREKHGNVETEDENDINEDETHLDTSENESPAMDNPDNPSLNNEIASCSSSVYQDVSSTFRALVARDYGLQLLLNSTFNASTSIPISITADKCTLASEIHRLSEPRGCAEVIGNKARLTFETHGIRRSIPGDIYAQFYYNEEDDSEICNTINDNDLPEEQIIAAPLRAETPITATDDPIVEDLHGSPDTHGTEPDVPEIRIEVPTQIERLPLSPVTNLPPSTSTPADSTDPQGGQSGKFDFVSTVSRYLRILAAPAAQVFFAAAAGPLTAVHAFRPRPRPPLPSRLRTIETPSTLAKSTDDDDENLEGQSKRKDMNEDGIDDLPLLQRPSPSACSSTMMTLRHNILFNTPTDRNLAPTRLTGVPDLLLFGYGPHIPVISDPNRPHTFQYRLYLHSVSSNSNAYSFAYGNPPLFPIEIHELQTRISDEFISSLNEIRVRFLILAVSLHSFGKNLPRQLPINDNHLFHSWAPPQTRENGPIVYRFPVVEILLSLATYFVQDPHGHYANVFRTHFPAASKAIFTTPTSSPNNNDSDSSSEFPIYSTPSSPNEWNQYTNEWEKLDDSTYNNPSNPLEPGEIQETQELVPTRPVTPIDVEISSLERPPSTHSNIYASDDDMPGLQETVTPIFEDVPQANQLLSPVSTPSLTYSPIDDPMSDDTSLDSSNSEDLQPHDDNQNADPLHDEISDHVPDLDPGFTPWTTDNPGWNDDWDKPIRNFITNRKTSDILEEAFKVRELLANPTITTDTFKGVHGTAPGILAYGPFLPPTGNSPLVATHYRIYLHQTPRHDALDFFAYGGSAFKEGKKVILFKLPLSRFVVNSTLDFFKEYGIILQHIEAYLQNDTRVSDGIPIPSNLMKGGQRVHNPESTTIYFRFPLVEQLLASIAAKSGNERLGHPYGRHQLADLRHLVSPKFPLQYAKELKHIVPPDLPYVPANFHPDEIRHPEDIEPKFTHTYYGCLPRQEAFLFQRFFPRFGAHLYYAAATTVNLHSLHADPTRQPPVDAETPIDWDNVCEPFKYRHIFPYETPTQLLRRASPDDNKPNTWTPRIFYVQLCTRQVQHLINLFESFFHALGTQGLRQIVVDADLNTELDFEYNALLTSDQAIYLTALYDFLLREHVLNIAIPILRLLHIPFRDGHQLSLLRGTIIETIDLPLESYTFRKEDELQVFFRD